MVILLKVEDIIIETKETRTFKLRQPGLKKIKYLPGQYITISVKIRERNYKRSYSISSAPSIDRNLNITVKRVKGGLVSNYLIDNLKIGDCIEVTEPRGNFYIDFSKQKYSTIFLWGFGSGITPLYSILNEVLFSDDKIDVYLIYGNQTIESTIFHHNLEVLKQQYPERLNIVRLFSKETELNSEDTFQCKINRKFLIQFLKNKPFKNNHSVHFICGPNSVKNLIKGELEVLGVHKENINFEDFKLLLKEEDLAILLDSRAHLKLNDIDYYFHIPKGKNILDALLDNNIDVPYSCQLGSCNLCKARIISGQTKMFGIQKSDDLSNGETLLCCTFPLSKEIEIEI